jgi:hypothetical protein
LARKLEAVGLSTDTGYLLWAQDETYAMDLDEYQEWYFAPFAETWSLQTSCSNRISPGIVQRPSYMWFFFRSDSNFEQENNTSMK